MRTFATLLLCALLVTPMAVAIPDALPMPVPSVEGPAGEGSQRVCRASGGFCAQGGLLGALEGCAQSGADYACTVEYEAFLAGDGLSSGCVEVWTSTTSYLTGCTNLPGVPAKAISEPVSKTYYNVAPDGMVREAGRVCVDPGTPQQRCDTFSTTVRFPGQGSIVTNSTVPMNTQSGMAGATICRDPASAAGCASVQITGRIWGCTGTGDDKVCNAEYHITQTAAGPGVCSTLHFVSPTDTTSCSTDAQPGITYRLTGKGKPVGAATRFHEGGSFCLDGGRCVTFGIDVPIAS